MFSGVKDYFGIQDLRFLQIDLFQKFLTTPYLIDIYQFISDGY